MIDSLFEWQHCVRKCSDMTVRSISLEDSGPFFVLWAIASVTVCTAFLFELTLNRMEERKR